MEKLSKVARYGVDGYGRQDIYRDDEGGEFVYHDDFEAMQKRAEAAEIEKAGAEERCRMMFDSKNHWADRARAAEAKLAELENQPPVAMRYRWAPPHMKMPDGSQFYGDWKLVGDAATANLGKDYERVNLYARPAPAINLSELVPDESELADRHIEWLNTLQRPMFSDEDWEELTLYTWLAFRDSYRIHRAATMRKIEGAR